MPLIISPGSRFERDGREPPDHKLTLKIQEQSAALMPVMRHCRQCRADAVGLLGEDRSGVVLSDLPMYSQVERKLELQRLDDHLQLRRARQRHGSSPGSGTRIAVATKGEGKVNLHFGHAQEFLVYEVEGEVFRLLGVRKIQAYCNGTAACGDEEAASALLKETVDLLRDCRLLLCAGIGTLPHEVLCKADILAVVTKETIEASLVKYGRMLSYFTPGAAH